MEKQTLNHRKGRNSRQAKRTETLGPKGMESGYIGFLHGITNEQTVPGLKMAPKTFTLSILQNLVTRMCTLPLKEVGTSREEPITQTGKEAAKSKGLVVMSRIEDFPT